MSAEAGSSLTADAAPSDQTALELRQELEQVQAAQLRQEIEHEQAVSDALARVAELERQLEAEKLSKAELKSKEDGLEQSLSHLREQYNALQTSLAGEASKASLLATQLSSVKAQNRSLQGSVTALENERSRAQASISTANEKVVQWEVRVRDIEGEVESRKVESRNLKFKVEALELNLKMANKDNATLSSSITRLTSDFASYRSTAQSQAQSASLELQTAQAALATSQASLSQLTSSQSQLANRLTASQTEVSTLRTQLVEQKAAFKQEVASQQRLAQSAERRAEDARSRLEEVEREWEEDLARRRESDVRTDEERLVWEEQRAELEAKVAELRDTVDRLVESGIAGDADSLPEDSSADQGAMLVSPSAALAGSLMRKRGMGISELYVENVRTKTELSKQQEETRRLEDSLQELLRDIQERAPLLRQQRQEYTRLVSTANDLAGQLSAVTIERDAEARRVRDEAAKVKQLQNAQVDLESHISDLSRQVVSLVREIGVRDEPSLAQYQHLDDAEMEQPEGDDIDSVITRNLIVFRSIPELQAQNQQLIKVVRELGKQLEAAEQSSAAAVPNKTSDDETDAEALAMMDEAGEIILGLKAKVEEKEVALAKQTRERDLFAKMLSQAGLSLPPGLDLEASGGTGGALLDVVKRNLESFRAELGLDAERLRQELSDARKEVNTASVALVRVEAERDFLKDRITALTEAGDLQKIQFDGLVTQNQGVKTDLMRVNMELRQAEEKRIEVEGHAERARMEAANLRAEKELWRATEEKLQKDVAEVAKDRAGLQSLIESLRRAEAETLRVQEETRRTALQTISNLQIERDDLRKELSAVSAKAASAATFEAERDQARIALASSTEAAERAAAEKNAAEQQLATARTGFEEEKTRYIGAERKRSEKIFSDNKRFFQQQKDWTVKETELRAQLASLETRLAETETRLTEAAAARDASAAALPTAEALEASILSSEAYLTLQKERDELQKVKDEAVASAATSPSTEEAVKTLTSELEALKAELASAATAAEAEKVKYTASERARSQNIFNDNKRFRAESNQLKRDIEALTSRAEAAEKAAAAAPTSTADGDGTLAAAAPASDDVIKAAVDSAVAKLKAEHAATLAEREQQLRNELTSTSTATDTIGVAAPSAEAVDMAVKAALVGKTDELKAEHDAALLVREMELRAELETAVKAAVDEATKNATVPAVDIDAAVKAAVTKREAELAAAHAEALKAVTTSSAGSSAGPSKEETEAAIAEAVAAAVAKVTSEATSRAAAQKMALEAARKKKDKAEADSKALRAELEALKAGGTPKTSPTAKVTALPKAGAAAPAAATTPAPKRTASVSSASGGPATRIKTAAAATAPSGDGLPSKPATPAGSAAAATPTAEASGTSIRGAGRGRGTRGTPRGRGAAAAAGSPATRVSAAAAKAASGGDGTPPPPRSLIGGALTQATASSPGGAGTKRVRTTEEVEAQNSTLLGRLNKGMIKRPKTDKDTSGGGSGEGSGGGSPSA